MERREEMNTKKSAMVGEKFAVGTFHAECKTALFAHLQIWKTLTHFEVLEECADRFVSLRIISIGSEMTLTHTTSGETSVCLEPVKPSRRSFTGITGQFRSDQDLGHLPRRPSPPPASRGGGGSGPILLSEHHCNIDPY